jgi:hypothetical protein
MMPVLNCEAKSNTRRVDYDAPLTYEERELYAETLGNNKSIDGRDYCRSEFRPSINSRYAE